MIYLILGCLALLYLLSLSTWEHMTNSDVAKKQEHHKKAKDWSPVGSTSQDGEPTNQIKGPKVPKRDPNDHPEPDSSGGKGKGVYPDIYGPDLTLEPGHKDSGRSVDYLPPLKFPFASEGSSNFPPGPKYPSPFLNDFSKIMK